MIREGISEYLSEFGYTVIQAKDGREALSKFNSDINLVILDIQIPFINGLEVLKEIRKKSFLPILILTAFSDEEYKAYATRSKKSDDGNRHRHKIAAGIKITTGTEQSGA